MPTSYPFCRNSALPSGEQAECEEVRDEYAQIYIEENLVQELPGEDSFRIPYSLQQPQLFQLTLAPEAKLDRISSGRVLEVRIYRSIWTP